MTEDAISQPRLDAASARLVNFHVDKLFGLYTHDIPLNQSARITAVVGPNGSGKTVCLKLIQALFNQKFSIFNAIQFDKCAWRFDSEEIVTITKKALPKPEGNRKKFKEKIQIDYRSRSGAKASWTPSLKDANAERRLYEIDRALPFLTRIGPELWRNDRTGQRLDFDDIIDLYAHLIPKPLREIYISQAPKELATLLGRLKCHLIETQRLLIMPQDSGPQEPWMGTRQTESTLSVERKSELLKAKIKAILTEYASLSQSLDRVFPERILSGDTQFEILDISTLSEKLAQLEQRRQQLQAAGILKTEFESLVSIPQNIDDSLLKVISVYVSHTNQKLSVFSDLLKRIQVFETLVNKRLMDKAIKITQAEGIEVTTRVGSRIPLRVLSSGEQHQLVLIFELLFESSPGELILIDEPELSLHISWQQAFIDDLRKIIQINPLDVVLATHSPALIGNHYDLAVELETQIDAK